MNMKAASKIGIGLFVAVLFGVGIFLGTGQVSVESPANAAIQQDEDRSVRECSSRTVKGSYGISTTGWIVSAGPIGPVADVGVITFDGDDGVSQTTTVSLNGMITAKRTLNGYYEVKDASDTYRHKDIGVALRDRKPWAGTADDRHRRRQSSRRNCNQTIVQHANALTSSQMVPLRPWSFGLHAPCE
jgi:hypothetical protein